MSDKLIHIYEGFSKLFPYILGLSVNFISFGDALLRTIVTCISMLSGAIVVHYLKPVVIRLIDKLKKN